MIISELPFDIDLLRQTHAGDSNAFQMLYRRYQAQLFRYALLRSGSAAIAADVVQEVFTGLLGNRYTFDASRGNLRYFLYGIVRFVSHKHEAASRRFSPLPDLHSREDDSDHDDIGTIDYVAEDANPLDILLKNQLAEDVRQAIAGLAPHYRDVLILFELHELTYLEIAEICQINIGTVRSRLSRARAALADKLNSHRETQELRA